MENKINYAAMTMDEIIFIDRNKAYGAYDLRQSYNQHIKRSLLGMICFTAFAVGIHNAYALWHPAAAAEKTIKVLADLSTVKTIEVKPPAPTEQKEQKTEQHKKGTPNAATAAAPAEMRATKNNTTPIDTIAPPPSEDIAIAVHAQDGPKGEDLGSKNGNAPVETVKSDATTEGKVFTSVEIMPEFPGGEAALIHYVGSRLSFPEYENQMGIQGKVFVGFIVDEKGKVTNVKILRGVSKGIDREALRVVSSLPDFKPGMQSGRPVRVSFVLPLDFHGASE